MTLPFRLRAFRRLCLLPAVPLAAQVPLPLPPAAQALKPLVGKVVDAVLKPKLKVDHFTLGGFKVTEVDPTGDATAEQFEGTGILDLPAPGMRLKITFSHLVLKGTAAEGTVEAAFPAGYHATHQDWTYHLTKAVISSNQGAHLEGQAVLAGIRVDLAPVPFTPTGLAGTLAAGELPLAEGAFEAALLKAEIVFGPGAPVLKGTVEVNLAPPLRHAETGESPRLESGPVAFDSRVLVGTGPVVEGLASNLPLLHKGSTWQMDTVTFSFERGTPRLTGPTRLQFPLQVFCQASDTRQPYRTGPAPCTLRAQAPKPPAAPRLGLVPRTKAAIAARFILGFEGFSGSFPLVPATLIPSGLTAYRLQLEGGSASVRKGVVEPDTTRLSGRVQWGQAFEHEVAFADVKASLSDGLYVENGSMVDHDVQVGGYTVFHHVGGKICDFSPSHSPKGLDPDWEGVYLPTYGLTLPEELYAETSPGVRARLFTVTQDGRFEANGGFSATLDVAFTKEVMVRIARAKLNPFSLSFADGVLVQGPTVTGTFELKVPGIFPDLPGGISFHLTHKGVEQIEIQPQAVADTGLVGVKIAIDRGTLNGDSWDFTGRFDFAVKGANLPSFPFDHFVLQATGGGIDGDSSPLQLGVVGQLWEAVPGTPNVNLWGFTYGLAERGFGTQAYQDEAGKDQARFYVGFGGNMDINPLLPTLYNRVLFTTQKGNPALGTIETENGFDLVQGMAGLGDLSAHLDFLVDAKPGGQVDNAYFFGNGTVDLATGDKPLHMAAGVRFGRSFPDGASSFPYFYALGTMDAPTPVPVAPDVEIFSFTGGLAQNFQPGDISDLNHIVGTPNAALGYALIGGVGFGTSDQYTFNGQLDLYVAQNLTTLLQGAGYLFTPRSTARAQLEAKSGGDNLVTANIAFTRNPTMLHAAFGADIKQFNGQMEYIGDVVMHFAPDQHYLHLGTRENPIKAVFLNGMANGFGYLTADFAGGKSTLGAGGGFSVDSGEKSFGPLWGRAYLNARGDLVIELDEHQNASVRGAVNAEGGAAFGMSFSTFWHDYDITIFSGNLKTALIFQAPALPRLSGDVVFHYRVLGGLFEGNVGAHLEF